LPDRRSKSFFEFDALDKAAAMLDAQRCGERSLDAFTDDESKLDHFIRPQADRASGHRPERTRLASIERPSPDSAWLIVNCRRVSADDAGSCTARPRKQ
jgi:hypothetical protein